MRKKLILILIVVILIISICILRFFRYYALACEEYAQNGIAGSVTYDINRLLCDGIDSAEVDYEEITKIEKNESGSIEYISINNHKINNIANEISSKIYEMLQKKKNDFGVPLGNAMGIKLLSSKGPEINVSIKPISIVEYKIKSEFIGEGINQTLHRISIVFNTVITCLAPFHESSVTIETEMVLSETLIIGKVPNTILSGWE